MEKIQPVDHNFWEKTSPSKIYIFYFVIFWTTFFTNTTVRFTKTHQHAITFHLKTCTKLVDWRQTKTTIVNWNWGRRLGSSWKNYSWKIWENWEKYGKKLWRFRYPWFVIYQWKTFEERIWGHPGGKLKISIEAKTINFYFW